MLLFEHSYKAQSHFVISKNIYMVYTELYG